MSVHPSVHLKNTAVVALGVLLIGVLGAACSQSNQSGNAQGPAKTLTIVAPAGPQKIGLLVRLGGPDQNYTALAGDVLITQDPKDGSLHGQLATAGKQTAPDEWEFTLRKGVKFHDGTDFNAEAAAWSIQRETAPDSPARVVRYATGLTAEAKDDYTLVVHCPTPCPILDRVAPQLQFESPAWREKNPDKNWPMGTGPFYLADWVDGQYLLYKKFDDYWGETGSFDEVKIVWRDEPSVRASMVANHEADLALDLTPEDVSTVPKVFNPDPIDYALIRLRGRDASGGPDPVWGDVRFRQALAYALDCDAMAQTLMKGQTKCAALPFNPTSVGWVEGPRYTYDPAKARQLLDQVLGQGKELNGVQIYARTGDVPKEWAEAVMSYWNDVGVHSQFTFVDGDRRDALDQPGVNGLPPDVMIIGGHTNDLYDASVSFAYLDSCNDPRAYGVCDPVFSQKLAAARAAGGQQRDTLMKELSADYYIGGANLITLWQMPTIFGASQALQWSQPQVGWLRPDQMSLSE